VIAGKPTIVISYSERHRDQVAGPLAEKLETQGIKSVLIGDEPLPPTIDSNPTDKIAWFFRHADMAVFLATPDDELVSGEIHTRQNIIDEHRLGHELPHLRHRLLVFKAERVTLPSNINPVHEPLPLDDPQWVARKVIEQAVVWQLLPPDRDVAAESPIDSSSENPSRATGGPGADTAATEQALGAISHASATLTGDAPDTPLIWRAQLAIAGLAANEGSADTLAVHLANRLFRRREDFMLRPSERLILLRTYLRHVRDDNVPVFAWLRDLGRGEIVSLLQSIAGSDSDSEVQAQALRLLAALTPAMPATSSRAFVAPLLGDESEAVRAAAIDSIVARNDLLLRDLLDDPDLLRHDGQRVARATALIDVRRYPGRVLASYLVDSGIRTAGVKDALLSRATRLSKRAVEATLDHSSQEVRRFGIELWRARGGLPSEAAHDLIARDNAPNVRLDALQALLDQGVEVSESTFEAATKSREGDDKSGASSFDRDEAAERAFWIRQPIEVLERRLGWSSLDGVWCYEAVGLEDRDWALKHVRKDLREDFRRVKEMSRMRLYKRYIDAAGSDASEATLAAVEAQFEKDWAEWVSDKLGNFILRRFQRAAIRILTVHGNKRDLAAIRRFADGGHSELRPDVLAFLERFGSANDAQRAVTIAETVYDDDLRRRAARLALRLAWKKDKSEVLSQLRAVHGLCAWSIEEMASLPGGIDDVWSLLRSDSAEARIAAAEVVWDFVREDLRSPLLTQYMGGRHFYNVVKMVDAKLYAPDWIDVAKLAS
jgi:hypothetical protein